MQRSGPEVEQQANLEAGRFEVIEHLGFFDTTYLRQSFQLDDNGIEANEIGPIKRLQQLPFVSNRQLDLRFERTETSGPLFDELRASIDAIAVLMDMTDVFALRGADIYRVIRTTRVSVGVRR